MLTVRFELSNSRCSLFFAFLACTAALWLGPGVAVAQESNEILPLSQVRAGMEGYAYTIFAGDQVDATNGFFAIEGLSSNEEHAGTRWRTRILACGATGILPAIC